MDKCSKIIVAEAGNLTPLKSKSTNEHDASFIHLPSSQSMSLRLILMLSSHLQKKSFGEDVDCIVLDQEKGRLVGCCEGGFHKMRGTSGLVEEFSFSLKPLFRAVR